MSNIAIRAERLGKTFRLNNAWTRDGYRYKSLRESVSAACLAPFRRKRCSESDLLWALRDASFEVSTGEVVGIIGGNGAGKSTLLKVLSRITDPTTGRADVFGRVRSLLEVGTGFHPELTGRENVFMNGAILGMRRSEIIRKFDEIVAFAEVDRFIDMPVKRYSSGMYMRLAFSVAAHLEPEILIVDEVLAVGDLSFQKKCLGKMGDIAHRGRTVLFVSHNMMAVQALCTRGLLLEHGRIVCDGTTADCLQRYSESLRHAADRTWTRPADAPSRPLEIHRVSTVLEGEQPNLKLQVEIELQSTGPHQAAFVALDILDNMGNALMQALPTVEGFICDSTTRHVVTLSIDLPPLIPGYYGMTVWTGSQIAHAYDMARGCAGFDIDASPTSQRTFPHSPSDGYVVPNSRHEYRPASV